LVLRRLHDAAHRVVLIGVFTGGCAADFGAG